MKSDKRFFYDNIADQFDTIMDRYDLKTRLDLAFLQFWGNDDLHGKLLLDAGCGTGWFSKWALERGARVISSDIGINLLKEARTKGSIHLVCGDLLYLPYSENQFDYIICSEAIEHTIDPRKAVSELTRVLAPGGGLIITVPNRFWHPTLRVAAALRLRPYEGYENWLNWEELPQWFRDFGVDVTSLLGFHQFPFQLKWTHKLLDQLNRKQYLPQYMVNIGISGKKV